MDSWSPWLRHNKSARGGRDLARLKKVRYHNFFGGGVDSPFPKTMCDVYRVFSSAKVEQMEAELSRQLSALREEVEENGFPQGASRCYRCGSSGFGFGFARWMELS